jgi:hypothetical protein
MTPTAQRIVCYAGSVPPGPPPTRDDLRRAARQLAALAGAARRAADRAEAAGDWDEADAEARERRLLLGCARFARLWATAGRARPGASRVRR